VEHNQWGENHLKTNYHTAEHFSSNRGNSITLTVPVEEGKKHQQYWLCLVANYFTNTIVSQNTVVLEIVCCQTRAL
jgi:hypothetical protein